MSVQLGSAYGKIEIDASGVQKSLGTAKGSVGDFSSTMVGMGKTAVAVIGAITAALTILTGWLGGKAVQAASDLNESMSKVLVVFGQSAKAVLDFAKTSAESIGVSEQAALEATATYGNLFTALGIGQKQAADMSIALVKLASDLASFNNLGTADVLTKIRSAMTGEFESVKVLGVAINESTLKAKAQEMGLLAVNGQLTAGNKALAVYQLLMGQTATAQGDFARTADGLANSQRIVSAQFANLSANVGTYFLPAAKEGNDILGNFAKTMNGAVGEGGQLNSTMVFLGASASLLFEALGKLADVATKAGIAAFSGLGKQLQGTAKDALTWGVNISVSLANGIIRGAADAIVAAMNFIGRLIESWLKPGSPPKITPDLDEWGKGAGNVYLKAFSEADYSVLEGLQGAIMPALETLSDLGQIAAEDIGPTYVQVSQDIVKALSDVAKTGQVSFDLFGEIADIGGQFGESLAELARRQLAVAASVRDTQKAEEDLARARQAESDAQQKVTDLQDELNSMIDSGRGWSAVESKRAELTAAQATLKASKDASEQAEKDQKAADDKADALKEQADLQARLVSQLVDMQRALVTPAVAAAVPSEATKKAGAGAVSPTTAPITFSGSLDTSSIDTAIENAKGRIKDKLNELFAPVQQAWDTSLKPALDRVSTGFQLFTNTLSTAWNSHWPEMQRTATEVWDKVGAVAKAFSDVFTGSVLPSIQTAINNVTSTLQEWGISWDDVFRALKIAAEIVGTVVVAALVLAIGVIVGLVNGLAKAVEFLSIGWAAIWDGIRQIVEAFAKGFAAVTMVFRGLVEGDWTQVLAGFKLGFQGAFDLVSGLVKTLVGIFETSLGTIAGFVSGFVEGVIGFFQNLYDQLVGKSIIPDLVRDIQKFFQIVIDFVQNEVIGKFKDLIKFLKEDLKNAFEWVRDHVINPFKGWLQGLLDIVNGILSRLNSLANKVADSMGLGGGEQSRATGGPSGIGGRFILHPNEWVLSEAQRAGRSPIPSDALSEDAIERLVGATGARNFHNFGPINMILPQASDPWAVLEGAFG